MSQAAVPAARHQPLKDPAGQGTYQDDPYPLFVGLADDARIVMPVTYMLVHQVVPIGTSNSPSLLPFVSPCFGLLDMPREPGSRRLWQENAR
jgi:hypothetical protein